MGTKQIRMAVVAAVVSTGLVGGAGVPTKASAAAATQDWLSVVNSYRSMVGVPTVTEDPSLSPGAVNHSCYMLYNGISHDEVPGRQGYSANGDVAGNSGNVAVTSVMDETARKHIELWMTGPFHAIGVIRPNLRTVGFGRCDLAETTPYRSGATLDVLNGLVPTTPLAEPIVFPGNGSTTSLDRFITESPNPLTFCGWSGSAGLPLIALMPETSTGIPSVTLTHAGVAVETCVLTKQNTTGSASQILAGDNAVVVVPRTVLTPGSYSVDMTTSARHLAWSFNVDPNAVAGVQQVSETTPLGSPGGSVLQPISPVRVVDTRAGIGSSRLAAGISERIQITGRGGIPSSAQALSANFTVTGGSDGGYLTVWNCSADRPVVSTLNYAADDTVPNGASVPLDSTGGVCVFSSASADLVVDANGYYAPDGGGRFATVAPVRLLDTRDPASGVGRLLAGSITPLKVTGTAGVPTGAALVSLNVTSIDPGFAGFVTVFPCGGQPPTVSSLNPKPGSVKPNVVLAPVSSYGTICLFSSTDVDVVVDITGYSAPAATLRFSPTAPMRLTDTRDVARVALNNGTGGTPLTAGTTMAIAVAGTRGISAGAKAVSVNITVTGAASDGFLTAWPCGARPNTSTVNYVTAEAIANGAQLPLSPGGQLCVSVSSDVHVVVDINGWWS